jgi:hypothetical protein
MSAARGWGFSHCSWRERPGRVMCKNQKKKSKNKGTTASVCLVDFMGCPIYHKQATGVPLDLIRFKIPSWERYARHYDDRLAPFKPAA